jgi:hypothetical protein
MPGVKLDRNRFLLSLALAAGFLGIGGCESRGGVVERFDDTSGLTIVTEPRPLAFARTESRLSRSARDYVYLGPVEVNERGTLQYYLWVGVASTIDRSYAEEGIATPDRLFVDVDGAPVEFELGPWPERVPRLGQLRAYNPAVTPFAVLAARVTLDQLALLSRESLGRVRIAKAGGPTTEYFLWRESPPWPAFARYAQ